VLAAQELELVAQSELVEWTAEGHLRHVKFVGIRTDKNAREVRREQVSPMSSYWADGNFRRLLREIPALTPRRRPCHN